MSKITRQRRCLKLFFIISFFLLFLRVDAQKNPLSTIADGADSLRAIEGVHVQKFYVLPLISISPETSLRLGAAAVYLFRKRGMDPNTQLSSIRVPISYTLNGQFKSKLDVIYYSNANRQIFNSTVQWFNFPLLFYGLGNATESLHEEIYTTQTLSAEFSYLKLLSPSFYVGGGYKYLKSNIVQFEEGGLLAQPGIIPGNNGSVSSGFNVRVRYDSRDNNLCASSGFYLDMSVASYEPWMGSQFDFTRFDFDGRTYLKPFGRHVLAFQLVLTNTWGNPSFETMALLGGKTIMRGHYEGRFRDNSLYATQVEYRLPIGRSKWIDNREKIPFKERWGVVGFLGLGDVASSLSAIEFNEIKSSVGFGIRYLVLPKERINVRVDFGFGTQNPGVYFNIREAF